MKAVSILWRNTHIQNTPAHYFRISGFPGGSDSKELACNAGDQGSIPGWERYPGEGNGTHSIILDCKIPWTEEPGGLWSMRWPKVRHHGATKTFTAPSEGLESLWVQVKNRYLIHPPLTSRRRDSERSADWPKVTEHLSLRHFPLSISLPASCPPPPASQTTHPLLRAQNEYSAVQFGWVVEHFVQFTLEVLILIFLIFPLLMSVSVISWLPNVKTSLKQKMNANN